MPKLTYANVMSTVAVFIALGGTSYAVTKLPKGSVGERELKKNAITSEKIKDGAVTAADLSPGAAVSGPRGPRGAEGPAGPQGATGPGAGVPEPWRGLAFATNWTNYQVVEGRPDVLQWEGGSYRKDPFGVVHLRGLVARINGTPTNSETVAVLPAGYRPKTDRMFSVRTGSYTAGDPPGRVDVRRDGSVYWIEGSKPNYLNLETIFFDTD